MTDKRYEVAAWPEDITETLTDLLGTMCFQFIDLARLWRETGTKIPNKAEAEQSFFLHAMLVHWFDKGDAWKSGWRQEIELRIDMRKLLQADKDKTK